MQIVLGFGSDLESTPHAGKVDHNVTNNFQQAVPTSTACKIPLVTTNNNNNNTGNLGTSQTVTHLTAENAQEELAASPGWDMQLTGTQSPVSGLYTGDGSDTDSLPGEDLGDPLMEDYILVYYTLSPYIGVEETFDVWIVNDVHKFDENEVGRCVRTLYKHARFTNIRMDECYQAWILVNNLTKLPMAIHAHNLGEAERKVSFLQSYFSDPNWWDGVFTLYSTSPNPDDRFATYLSNEEYNAYRMALERPVERIVKSRSSRSRPNKTRTASTLAAIATVTSLLPGADAFRVNPRVSIMALLLPSDFVKCLTPLVSGLPTCLQLFYFSLLLSFAWTFSSLYIKKSTYARNVFIGFMLYGLVVVPILTELVFIPGDTYCGPQTETDQAILPYYPEDVANTLRWSKAGFGKIWFRFLRGFATFLNTAALSMEPSCPSYTKLIIGNLVGSFLAAKFNFAPVYSNELVVYAGAPVQSYELGIWSLLMIVAFMIPVVLMIDPPTMKNFSPWWKRQRERYLKIVSPCPDPENLYVDKVALKEALLQLREEAIATKGSGFKWNSELHAESVEVAVVLAGVEAAMRCMPEQFRKKFGSQTVEHMKLSLRTAVQLSIGPYWKDSVSSRDKVKFMLYYYTVIGNFTSAMPVSEPLNNIFMELAGARGASSPTAAFESLKEHVSLESEGTIGEYPEWLTSFDCWLNGSMSIMGGTTVHHFEKLLEALAIAPSILFFETAAKKEKVPLQENIGYIKAMQSGIGKIREASNISEGVVAAMVYFAKFAYNLTVTGGSLITVFNYMERGDDDMDWLTAAKYSLYLKNGSHAQNNVTLNDIWSTFIKVEKMLLRKLKFASHPAEKSGLLARLEKITLWKDAWFSFSAGGRAKKQPYTLTMYGKAGIGKTVAIEFLKNYLHQIAGISEPSVAVVNETDQYDSTLKNDTTMAICDDFAMILASKRQKPLLDQIYRLVNSITTSFNGAGVEEKGSKFNNLSFVIFTTNSPGLQAEAEVNDGDAVWRRMGLKLKCVLRPEYAKPLAGGKFELNRSAIPAGVIGFPPWLTYQQYALADSGEPVLFGPIMSADEVVKLVRDDCDAHFANEEKRLVAAELNATCKLCPHRLVPEVCIECREAKLESEANDPAISEISQFEYFVMQRLAGYVHLFGTGFFGEVCTHLISWAEYFSYTWITHSILSVYIPAMFIMTATLYFSGNPYAFTLPFFGSFEVTLHVTAALYLCKFIVDSLLAPILAFQRLCALPPDAMMAGFSCAAARNTWNARLSLLGWAFGGSASMGVVYVALRELRKHAASPFALSFTGLKVKGNSVVDLISSTQFAMEDRVLASNMILKAHEEYMTNYLHITTSPGFVSTNCTTQTVNSAITIDSSTTSASPPVGAEDASHAGLVIDAPTLEEKKAQVLVDAPSWAQAIHVGGQAKGSSKTMTLEQARPLLERALVILNFTSDDIDYNCQTCAMMLQMGFLLVPNHIFQTAQAHQRHKLKCTINSWVSGRRADFPVDLYLSASARIPDQDLRLCVCNVGTPVRDLTALLPTAIPPIGSTISTTFLCRSIESGAVNSCMLFSRRSVLASDKSEPLEGYRYSLPFDTSQGMCMSPLIRSCGGLTLESFHIAGNKQGRQGASSICTYDAYQSAVKQLVSMTPAAFPTSQPNGVNSYNPKTGKTRPQYTDLHPKSPGMFLTPGMMVQFECDVDRGSRGSKPTAVINKNVHHAAKRFNFVRKYDTVQFNPNLEFRQSMMIGCSTCTRSVPLPLLDKAFQDFTSIIPLAISRSSQKQWYLNRPLTVTEVMEGIPDNPHAYAVRANTSFGWPIGSAKKKTLAYHPDEDKWSLPPEIYQALLDAEYSLLANEEHTGQPFNVIEKSEGRLLEKCDKARLVFACPYISYILIQRYLAPALWVINDNPELFETSLGRDRLSPNWHDHLAEILAQPTENGFAMDFSTYDHSQHQDLRNAAVNVFVKLLKEMGYDEACLRAVRLIAGEFLHPLLNYGGLIVHSTTLQPSGNNLTAHTNGFGGSLLLRCSFFLHHTSDDLHTFRDYFKIRNLGDDNWGAVTPLFNKDEWSPATYSVDCNEWGLKATSPIKSEGLSIFGSYYDMDYLKSKPYYNEALGCVVGVLDPMSIFKPLQVIEPSSAVSYEEQSLDIVRGVVRESFFYGREAHDWSVAAARAYFADIGMSPDDEFVEITFDEKVALFREKFALVDNKPLPKDCPTKPPFHEFWLELGSESTDGPSSTEGLTEFIMSEVATDVTGDAVMMADPMVVPDSGETLDKFFERPIEIFNFPVYVGQPTYQEIDPFGLTFQNPLYREKLTPWAIGRCGIELTFVAAQTMGHSGLLMITMLPNPGQNTIQPELTLDTPTRLCVQSQRDVLFWDITTEGGAKMVCPYPAQQTATWMHSANWSGLTTVAVASVGTVLHVSNNEMPIYVKVYARLIDFTFSGATALRAEASEPFSSKVSAVADMAALSSAFLAEAPGLAMVADFASLSLGAVAGVARYFGHSRPLESERYMFAATSPPMATMNNNLPGRTVALDKDHGVSMSSQITGRVISDEMVFTYLYSKPVILGVFKWFSTQPPNTVLFNLHNTCCPGVYGYALDQVALPGYSLVTANFGLAHWVNKYRITVSTPAENAGTLKITYEPTGIVSGSSTVTNYSVIADLQTTRVIELEVQWQQPESLLTTHEGYFLDPFGAYNPRCMNGSLQVTVESPLSPFSDSEQTAWIIVEGWLDEQVVLGDYAPMDLSSYGVDDNATVHATGGTGGGLSRALAPVRSTVSTIQVTLDEGLIVRPKEEIVTLHPTVQPTHPPSSKPSTGRPTTMGETNAPTAAPVFTGPPPTSAPTRLCESVVEPAPAHLVGSASFSTLSPYLSADGTTAILPHGCPNIAIPFYSDGVIPSTVKFTYSGTVGDVLVGVGVSSFTLASTSSVIEFTISSGAAGLHSLTIELSTMSGSGSITDVQVSIPGGYAWAVLQPPAFGTYRSTLGGYNVTTYTTAPHTSFTVPGFPWSEPLCGESTSTGFNCYASVYCEGTLRRQGTSSSVLVGNVPEMSLYAMSFPANSPLVLNSGYDSPELQIHSVCVLLPLGSEATIGNAFRGRELIAPIHLGEQVASIRALWKVFKQSRRMFLDPANTSNGLSTIATANGITTGAIQSYVYDIGDSYVGNRALLTLDKVIFLSFGCVRGGMTCMYTAEFGDGLIQFRRAVDDSTTEESNSLRGFEQMHTAIQRSMVINWPCYMREKFLIPRQLSYTQGRTPSMVKQVTLSSLASAETPLVVREDNSIGEDFSLSYFIGAPVLRYFPGQGSSIPPHSTRNVDQAPGLGGLGTYSPAGPVTAGPSTMAGTATPTSQVTNVPTGSLSVPSIKPTSIPISGPTSAPARRLSLAHHPPNAPSDETVRKKPTGYFFPSFGA